MNNKIGISVDLMGGNNSPHAAIDAIRLLFSDKEYDPLSSYFFLYGDETAQILLEKSDIPEEMYSFRLTANSVTDEDNPLDILRGLKPDNSMELAIRDVQNQRSKAMVSSGNTGALMVLAKQILGCIEGIKRPAIVGTIPTKKGRSVVLDLGANLECSEQVLLQFAMMGRCFLMAAGIQCGSTGGGGSQGSGSSKGDNSNHEPRIGLLNIGTERSKGRAVEKKAYDLLEKSGLNFIGYIEGHDITEGVADVVVTDGYTGNIVLKTAEGVAIYLKDLIRQAVNDSAISKIGALLLRSSLKKHMLHIEPYRNNGAMFVGLNGIVVKSHGGSKKEGVATALRTALLLAQNDVNRHIVAEIDRLQHDSKSKLDIVDKIKSGSNKILNMLNFHDEKKS